MKVRILRSGGYNVTTVAVFPVEVEVSYKDLDTHRGFVQISTSELKRVGFAYSGTNKVLCFLLNTECEIVEDAPTLHNGKTLIGFKIKSTEEEDYEDWFLSPKQGYTDLKEDAYVYPVDFLTNGKHHCYRKDIAVLIPVYK